MELKVWVDGIQRVVCGANLSTTCQDVVVALAHAMGRTGRFTLIEKWREVERPLTPGECPLKSLHKWGEYAAEVRFYLMQADQQQEKPPQKSSKQRSAQLAETEDNFSHNFSPQPSQALPPPASSLSLSTTSSSTKYLPHQPKSQPQPPPRSIHQTPSHPVPLDAIKRSSTFSGAVNSNYAASMPASNSLHAKLDNLKQQQQQQQQQPPQYHQHSHHPQKQKQPPYQHLSLPRQNHSGQQQQQQQQQPVNSNNNKNGVKAPQQQYQNIPVPKPSQTITVNDSNQNTPRNPPHHLPQKPTPAPAPHNHYISKSHRQNNGNLSARSSASSNNSTSPRNHSSNSNSLSPGRGGSGGSGSSSGPPTNNISSSPSQDSRYLHPANIPRPSDSYSNVPPDSPPSTKKENETVNRYTLSDIKQPQPKPKPTAPSIRPAPKPAPRTSHHRQQSPTSAPYENLPPRRSSQGALDPELPMHFPDGNQMLRPPPRRRRDPPSSDPTTNKPEISHQFVEQIEDPNQWKGRSLPNNYSDKPAPQEKDYSRGGDRHQKKMNDNRYDIGGSPRDILSSTNNDHNFNSDLSDDCFQGSEPSVNKSHLNIKNDTNNVSKPYQSRQLPTSSSKMQTFQTPTPQLSQTLPSFSSSPSRSRPSEFGQKTAKSQTLPTSNPVTPERTRRSEGGRVNFVESALLRQQRSSQDADSNKNDQFAAEGRQQQQQRDSSRDRKQSGEHFPNSVTRSREDSSLSVSHSQSLAGHTSPGNKYYEDFTDNSVSTPFTSIDQSGLSPLEYSNENQYSHQTQPQQYSPHPQQSPRTSAFKVVSPRSNHSASLSSSQSPISPVAHEPPPVPYNLDNQNFDFPVNLDHHHNQHHYQHQFPNPPHPQSSYPEFPTTVSSSSPPFPSSNQQRPHSRQASLEIEEYDLDQNFPDVSHQKDDNGQHYPPYQQQPQQSSTLPRVARRKSLEKQGQGHTTTEYVMDRPSVGGVGVAAGMEPEYMRMLRQVKMQQEQLKILEAQTHEMDTEISTLETDQSNLDLKLDVVVTELESLEKMEETLRIEMEELDRVEWVNVLDGEAKCEADLRSQMSKLRVELTGLEKKIGELKEEEKSKEDAFKTEQQILAEKEKKEELQVLQQLTDTKKDLSNLDALLQQTEVETKTLEKGIEETVNQIKSQEQEAERLEKLLHNENLKNFQSNPVPKEPPPVSTTTATTKITTDIDNNLIMTKAPAVEQSSLSVPSLSSRPTTPRSRPPSETGEAIIKILEGRLSPRVSPLPASNDDDSSGGGVGGGGQTNTTTTSSSLQNPVKSTTTLVKNPNGVWV